MQNFISTLLKSFFELNRLGLSSNSLYAHDTNLKCEGFHTLTQGCGLNQSVRHICPEFDLSVQIGADLPEQSLKITINTNNPKLKFVCHSVFIGHC